MNSINLNELTLENVGQWPLAVKISVLIGVSLLIIGLGYWLIIQDNFNQFDRLKGQEATLKTDLENKQRQLFNLPAYREELKIMSERFVSMLKQLPEKNEMPGLLEEISKTGVASGLTFELFAPQPEVSHDFYVELPIKISVVGTYFQLAMFVSRVAQMNRIVTLHDFSIEGVSSKDQKIVSGDELVMNITAKIYRYRTQ
ncbi:type 4a pilus biogenesis protein PilO [Fluoribacter dumoffii]|uniref:type 4a pilus biogenesis protein PilO n=1 Tax=Fluoribacter dumoffii TaxID=463 RepID=UPI002242DE36|nr:type 4a pilus biogenesis protein PilO [Fluoribacter dumoffii]MCW8384921.1 type 4a pilus biogenesis protein PilO [Fluoribacter dumoffii]MCW8417983.1 type 4a pilus biogenesis protein PilO [Fluoribacter dumoffii]MCW8454175.1 type 4a pilus biogenesis protein PilO [Fluoribacter dumoffii]MCW8461751.1 type 4a pilus biogenesis protein PilO [Fluoribacter dumoffii]MCW8481967.1 type 4a pilus biogenesis protein PilO [Fluoribacter dumoffii]